MRVFVAADDLTGGNGTAALLEEVGFEVWVHLGTATDSSQTGVGQLLLLDSHADAVDEAHVLDLGTRNLPNERATAQVSAFINANTAAAFDLIALRIDSTLRGPIAPSLNVLLEQDEQMMAMVVPAHPKSGRTTVEGIHLVNGMPVHKTSVGADPFAPVLASVLMHWIGSRCDARCGSITLSTVKAGSADVCDAMIAGHAADVRIWFCDAKTLADIDTLADAAQRFRMLNPSVHLLPVDSGPFTVAVVKAMRRHQGFAELSVHSALSHETDYQVRDIPVSTPAWLQNRPQTDCAEAPLVFGISASLMRETKEQMDILGQFPGVAMIRYNGESVEWVIEQMREMVAKQAVLQNTGGKGDSVSIQILFVRTDTWEVPVGGEGIVTTRLSMVLRAVVEAFPSLIGFYLSGGETARVMLSGVGVSKLKMKCEIAPITTLSMPADGLIQDAWLVTKGGAIGNRAAAVSAISTLYQVITSSHYLCGADMKWRMTVDEQLEEMEWEK